MQKDSTKRFSDRVVNYERFRPRFPAEMLKFLEGSVALYPESVLADIGSGTGISSELFLNNDHGVFHSFSAGINFHLKSSPMNRFLAWMD